MGYLDELFRLEGKTAFLTGGGGVLAGAIGEGLAKAGVRIVFADIAGERAEEAAQRVINMGGEAIGVGSDVLNVSSMEKTCDEIVSKYSKVDILLNAAGRALGR